MRTLLQPKHVRSGTTISGDPTLSHAAQFSTTAREAGGEAGAVLPTQCYPAHKKTKAIPETSTQLQGASAGTQEI